MGLPSENCCCLRYSGPATRVFGSKAITYSRSKLFGGGVTDERDQEDVLYLTDPAGLRTILTKEHGDIYEEPPMIIE
jgi:hypothetical protein